MAACCIGGVDAHCVTATENWVHAFLDGGECGEPSRVARAVERRQSDDCCLEIGRSCEHAIFGNSLGCTVRAARWSNSPVATLDTL